MLKTIQICLFTLTVNLIFAQSFYFGPAIGPGVNFQRWEEADNDPLLSVNAEVFIESMAEETKSAFFASLGYKTRGSSNIFSNASGGININAYKYKFNNAVLELGAKRYFNENESRPYYLVGVRGEYTVSTNLNEFRRFNTPFFPDNSYVRKFLYGFTLGGGYEMKFNDFLNGFIQISMCPDLNLQYYQPPLENVFNPFGFGTQNLGEKRVKNTSVEIKFGLKILRKVVYE